MYMFIIIYMYIYISLNMYTHLYIYVYIYLVLHERQGQNLAWTVVFVPSSLDSGSSECPSQMSPPASSLEAYGSEPRFPERKEALPGV